MITTRQLAEACGAELLCGRTDAAIHSAANIDDARDHQLTFIANSRHLDKLSASHAGAVIVPKGTPKEATSNGTCLLAAADPEMAFITCLHQLYPLRPNPGTISPQASVHPSAVIGRGSLVEAFASIGADSRIGVHCQIHAGCRIGTGVTVGDHCVLHANVVLYDGITLGDGVVIHAGAAIGADGFGYKFRQGEHVKFPQVGSVDIGSNVEIGANTCIDRAALGVTRIGEGTKIDNLVHIAHNVSVGSRALLCGQVGIGGSTVIEDYAVLASQCGIADHVTVGQQAMVLAQAGVTKNVANKDQVMGFPATNRRDALHHMAALRRLVTQHRSIDELVGLLPTLRTAPVDRDGGEGNST
jgi:UDP-3-O-[3-hydroxymyristoyl] glucosamine N-acyltransferase